MQATVQFVIVVISNVWSDVAAVVQSMAEVLGLDSRFEVACARYGSTH
jgi:hypothetical protein